MGGFGFYFLISITILVIGIFIGFSIRGDNDIIEYRYKHITKSKYQIGDTVVCEDNEGKIHIKTIEGVVFYEHGIKYIIDRYDYLYCPLENDEKYQSKIILSKKDLKYFLK